MGDAGDAGVVGAGGEEVGGRSVNVRGLGAAEFLGVQALRAWSAEAKTTQ